MKKILLCTDGSSFAENSYRYGAWFANRLAAEGVKLRLSHDSRKQNKQYARLGLLPSVICNREIQSKLLPDISPNKISAYY